MVSVRSIPYLLICYICSFVLAAPDVQFENTKVLRVMNINTAIVREDIGIRAKNIDDKPATEYYMIFPTSLHDHVAFVSASLRREKTPLKIASVQLEDNVYIYKISLDKPVEPQDDVILGIKVVYTHHIQPLPKQIPQVARQHAVIGFNSYFLSPYFTNEVKTTVHTSTTKIVKHTGADDKSKIEKSSVIYGPYNDVPPLSYFPATCHFENLKSFLTVTSLVRDLEVSHWGNNLAVEEHYALHNDGASLEKEFSRIQYQMSESVHEQTNVFKKLSFNLPVTARDAYYRDEVGNVSTSHFRVEKERAVLEISPRFPIFGGWGTTWYHGYNANLGSFVHKTGSEKYILNVNFVENANDMTIDKATVRVVLPEGSKNIKVTTPFDVDSQSISTHYTYFDSTGRTMVVLEKRNLVKEHELPFQIEYEYSTMFLLQKPLVISSAFFVFFITSILINKMSLSISNPEKLKKQ